MSVYDVVDVVFYFRLWKRKKPLFARGSEKISIWKDRKMNGQLSAEKESERKNPSLPTSSS
jgi:hypothetical protein